MKILKSSQGHMTAIETCKTVVPVQINKCKPTDAQVLTVNDSMSWKISL